VRSRQTPAAAASPLEAAGAPYRDPDHDRELDYVGSLNGVLPPDIRVLAWAPVTPDFSPRFNCESRTYKYFFLRRDMDISRMREAANHLVGTHDFRNFCRMDVVNVANFTRHLFAFDIDPVGDGADEADPLGLWVATIRGTAFLYHQVRCMMQVLFHVANGAEALDLVPRLLDVTGTPRKPNYGLASGAGLVLWDCAFPSLEWEGTAYAERSLLRGLVGMFEAARTRSALLEAFTRHVDTDLRFSSLRLDDGTGLQGIHLKDVEYVQAAKHLDPGGAYRPVARCPLEPAYEERLTTLSQRKRARRDSNIDKGLLKVSPTGGAFNRPPRGPLPSAAATTTVPPTPSQPPTDPVPPLAHPPPQPSPHPVS